MTYRPPAYRNDDRAALLDVIAAFPLALLVTTGGDDLSLTHVPLLAIEDGERLVLRGHIARANDHWRHQARHAAAVFRAAAHHISPSWYATKQLDPRVVPTYDYVAVEARGPVRFIHDTAWLDEIVRRLTDTYEPRAGSDWRVDDAPGEYVASQLQAIVGVEMTVESLTGTFKLNQNHPDENISGITSGLDALGTPSAALLRRFIAEA